MKFYTRKIINSTVSPSFYFGMNYQGLVLPGQHARHTSTVGNVKIALSDKIVLLLHSHVDFPYSLLVTCLWSFFNC